MKKPAKSTARKKFERPVLFFSRMWYNAGSYFSGKDIFILKAIGRVISSAILLVLTGLMVAFAKAAPNVVFSFYPALSKSILSAIASVSSLVPIALWEVLAAVLALLYAYPRVHGAPEPAALAVRRSAGTQHGRISVRCHLGPRAFWPVGR